MPGVVMMENGIRDTLPTNHDRDNGQLANGGSSFASQASPDRQNGVVGKAVDGANNGMSVMVNGNSNGTGDSTAGRMDTEQPPQAGHSPSRMNDLPDEIQHITQGYVPLGVLLSRLAQQTHNQLSDEIMALAKMPVPAPAVNGNSAHGDSAPEDNSAENVSKKLRLLNFVQERHAEWVKALVIANWSRKAEPVSKLIDLMHHINMQRKIYDDSLDYMINIKRDLTFARLPNPDLRTALQVLSTGEAPWMPDFNYLEPPPLTPKEQLQWVENLNTLLSIRLNLEDHENIPYQFQDYSIDSGRVTFKVAGEFEVDLTIADEDFEKQFWFIDFRFAFKPAPEELSDALRIFLERKVNEALEKDGLHGCYKLLHEFVLTHKITEYVRQALEISKGRWVDTLKVERLNRAMSIQYWSSRYPPEGPKSWIILGVHSGKRPDAPIDPKSSSHLTLRWFRDNKEVKDAKISFDDADISTENLLNRVIAKHVEYILTTIHDKLKSRDRFTKRQAGLALKISQDDPVECALRMQLGYKRDVSVRISGTTGMVSMNPQSATTWKGESKLNWQSRDPIQDGLACLEGVRCHYAIEELNRRGKSMGWSLCRAPVKMDDVKPYLNTRDPGQLTWLQRRGWPDQWYVMVSLSLSGDRWWLIETSNDTSGTRVSSFTQLPLSSEVPDLSDRFFSNLTVFTAGMISHITDLGTLHQRRVQHVVHEGINYSLPANVKIPAVFIRLSDILKQRRPSSSNKKHASWALDFVQIRFKGMNNTSPRPPTLDPTIQTNGSGGEKKRLSTLVDARLKVADPARFGLLKGNVERDVAFNEHLGVFALRLQAEVGRTILDTLAYRLQALDRLADCIDAIRRSDRDVQCEEITPNKVVVSYSDQLRTSERSTEQQTAHRWKATLDLRTDVINILLEAGNPQLRVLDLFKNLLNSELRVVKLPFFLSSTLPIQNALDSVEDAWEKLTMNNQGRVEVFSPHLDWFNIRYILPGPNRNAVRRVTFQIRLRDRRGDVLWHLFREEPGSVKQPDDEFEKALQKVWQADNRLWQYLNDSAAVHTDHRVGELIKAVDDVIRPFATQSASPSVLKMTQAKVVGQSRNQIQAQAMNNKLMAANKARPQQTGAVVVLDD